MSETIKLTVSQREFLEALDDNPGGMLVGKYSIYSLHVARSLERRGMVNVDAGDYGYMLATWDDEFHADWIRMKDAEFQRAQESAA